ncbi:Na/Pi symporter [Granulosicoccaceae sp. 1_MG-2023]|nr:Na/Pi symporter [Granulosicoccaceae sp. 1_MG-2023]
MLNRWLFVVAAVLLGAGLWLSPSFQAVAAGASIFLFGMLMLEEGFTAFTGGTLERLLRRTTGTVSKGLLFGIVTTTLMQSSSLVSLVTISFISAGMISLIGGIAIVFGANLGTTTGAWLLAAFGLKVKLAAYAMPMLVFGVFLRFQKARHWKGIGAILAGLGFLFLGIDYMKDGFEAYGHSIDLRQYAMPGVAGLLVYTLVGIAATVLMQSSHAALALILSALAASQITYLNALALAIGANVGTTITAILGALGAAVDGRRLAGAHLVFNLATGVMALLLIRPLAASVDWLALQMGIAADNFTLKLALFHTLFNLLGVILMLPLIRFLAAALVRLMPGRTDTQTQALYLNAAAAELPDTAISVVRQEVWHLFDMAFDILAYGVRLRPQQIDSDAPLEHAVRARVQTELDFDNAYRHSVKVLSGEILGFVASAQDRFPSAAMQALFELRDAALQIVEAVKHTKHLQKNLHNRLYSHHPVMSTEYDQLRLGIALAMREVRIVGRHEGSALAVLQIDEARAEARAAIAAVYDRVHAHLNRREITPAMATSLLNDANYARETVDSLFAAAEKLISTADSAVAERVRDNVDANAGNTGAGAL